MCQELNFRQRMFVEYYLGECQGNATEAARRAGYSQPQVLGQRTLQKVEVQAAIDARVDEAALKPNEILGRLADHATGSLEDFMTTGQDGSTRLDLKKAKERGKLHLVKKIKWGRNGLELELYNAQTALELLGKYRKLFTEKIEHSGSIETVIGYDHYQPGNEEAPSLGPETAPDTDGE